MLIKCVVVLLIYTEKINFPLRKRRRKAVLKVLLQGIFIYSKKYFDVITTCFRLCDLICHNYDIYCKVLLTHSCVFENIAETVFLNQMPERVLLKATHFHLPPMNHLHWNRLLRICAGGFKIIIII